MSQTDHRLNIIVTEQGLTETAASVNSFGQATTGLVHQQDALSTAFGKTQGAALKTGQEFSKTEKEITNTGKASTTTAKQSMSLGDAFKSSALQITAFASGLISTIGQLVSYQKTSASLERQDAILEKRWLSLSTKQKQLALDIKNGTITTEEAAQKTKEYELQQKALEAQTDIIDAKHQQHTLTLMNLATTALPTVINGISGLTNIYTNAKGIIDQATQSTDAASASTEQLGTVADTTQTIGIIPMIKNFANWITGAKDATKGGVEFTGAMTNMGTEIKKSAESSNILVKAFKAMGSAVVSFATSIKTDIGGAIGIIDKIKTGFISFFANIRDGFVAFGSSIKNAIKSLTDIKAASILAFVTNPAFLAIAAISALVVALSGNMFGFRDALNGVGKALGDMAPRLVWCCCKCFT